MGTKTVANDLDNARVWFDQVRLPKRSLLNKFAEIEGDSYVQTTDERSELTARPTCILRIRRYADPVCSPGADSADRSHRTKAAHRAAGDCRGGDRVRAHAAHADRGVRR